MPSRPAEVTTLAAAIAYLILYLVDALDDPTLMVVLTMIIGAIPAAVTWTVTTIRSVRGG